LFDVVYIDD